MVFVFLKNVFWPHLGNIDTRSLTIYFLSVAFTPIPNERVIHMIIIGCRTPAKRSSTDQPPVWGYGSNYSEIGANNATDGICGPGGNGPFIFQYTNGNPAFHFPDGIGFPVGNETDVRFFLLNIHFDEAANDDVVTSADVGVIVSLIYDSGSKLKPAGVIRLHAKRSYPPHTVSYARVACIVKSDIQMHPFSFHVHGHKLQVDISGWTSSQHNSSWRLIGGVNPQHATSYYPVHDHDIVIQQGDIVASRCIAVNREDHVVVTG